jgi:hypothetical protein
MCTADGTITLGSTGLPWVRINLNITGSDNRIVRMDGTSNIQDSGVTLTDNNEIQVPNASFPTTAIGATYTSGGITYQVGTGFGSTDPWALLSLGGLAGGAGTS